MNVATKAKAANPFPADPEFLPLTPVGKNTDRLLDHHTAAEEREPWPLRYLRENKLFAAIVVLPTFLALVYFGLFAADQYSSEARFIVRNIGAAGILPSGAGSLATLASGSSTSRAQDETYSVNEYMQSRDAVGALVEKHNLREILSRSEGDFLTRFPNMFTRDNFEQLYRHYLKFIDVGIQGDTGISVLEVRAFRAEDAQAIALALLSRAEELVNKLNVRARADAVKFSEQVVRQAEAKLGEIHDRLTDFRNREMIVDPGKQSQATLELVARLTGEVAGEKAQLEQILTMTPDSPQIEALRTRIRAMEQQINQQRLLVTGGSESMAQKLSQFEQISLERELAVKSLSSAFVSLENSRQEAARQQLYLERVVEPHVSDYPAYPKRLGSILFVLGLSFCLYWIIRSVRTAILEHG